MANVLLLANPAGGSGKTTLAVHLALGLAIQGARTLLIDADPQANASYSVGLLNLEDPWRETLQLTVDCPGTMPPIRWQWVLPDDPEVQLAVVPASLVMGRTEQWPHIREAPDPQHVAVGIRKALDPFAWVIIDGPPYLGYWNQVALHLAQCVLIPVSATGNYPKIGYIQLEQVIESIRWRDNPWLRVLGVVSTMVARQTKMGQLARAWLEAFVPPELILRTEIPRGTTVERSQSQAGTNLFVTDPRSPVTFAIVNLLQEVQERFPLATPAAAHPW